MASSECSIEGCNNPTSSRGLCARCYRRISRAGTLSDHPARISTDRHSLSDVDEVSATATCSVCGPTRIRVRKSRATHECRTVRDRDPSRYETWERRLNRRYGVSVEEYARMWLAQDGDCAVCQRDVELYVDHSHDTGEVRGLLCNRCNVALGFLRDSADSMARAIAYLT